MGIVGPHLIVLLAIVAVLFVTLVVAVHLLVAPVVEWCGGGAVVWWEVWFGGSCKACCGRGGYPDLWLGGMQ